MLPQKSKKFIQHLSLSLFLAILILPNILTADNTLQVKNDTDYTIYIQFTTPNGRNGSWANCLGRSEWTNLTVAKRKEAKDHSSCYYPESLKFSTEEKGPYTEKFHIKLASFEDRSQTNADTLSVNGKYFKVTAEDSLAKSGTLWHQTVITISPAPAPTK